MLSFLLGFRHEELSPREFLQNHRASRAAHFRSAAGALADPEHIVAPGPYQVRIG